MPAPLTGFEQRDRVAPWTTWEEEETFLAALESYSDAIRISVVGESVNGRPMRLVQIGTGARKVLYIAQQHGSELSGREAMFTMLRQWADSTDPALDDYLSRVTVLVMPTCHPDNFEERLNVNGANLNRDHVRLSQPETLAMHRVITEHQPDLIVDWHEGANIAADFASQPPENVNVDPAIKSLSVALNTAVKDGIEGNGYTWELYQGPDQMMRGPENLANSAGVRHMVGVLLETKRVYGNDTDAARRHDLMLYAAEAVWRWHHPRIDAVARARQEARSRAIRDTKPVTLHVDIDTTGPVIDPVPAFYYLTPTQYEWIAAQREVSPVQFTTARSGYAVPTAQPLRAIVAYMFDPQSSQRLVTSRLTPFEAPPPMRPGIRIDASTTLRFRHDGVTYGASLKVKA